MEKVHIGMILNLEKDTDATINNILNNLPTYESKSKYLRKAILFYAKHQGKEVDIPTSKALDTPAKSISSQSLEMQELLETIGSLAKSLEDVKNEVSDLRKNKETENLRTDKGKEVSKKKEKGKPPQNIGKDVIPEPPLKEAPIIPDDEIVVNNDTKASTVSYADFMGDFLS